jgi:hypothetical protein
MEADALAIAVNNCLREVAARLGVTIDPDGFGLRLSRAVARRIRAGEQVPNAVKCSIRQLKTSYFAANRISRVVLGDELCRHLTAAGVPQSGGSAKDHILKFKAYAERQLVAPLRRDPSEENARSILQSYMQPLSRTYREAVTGAGRADILLLDSASHDVIEVKLWRNISYYEDGLHEVAEYLRTEGLEEGHYVVFDIGACSTIPRAKGAEVWDECFGKRTVHVYFVRLPCTPPSKLGRQRRAVGASKRRADAHRPSPPAASGATP